MGELDTKAVQAARDKQFMEEFIQQNEFFILKCVSSAAHRYVTKSDDEWSIALLAFSQAVAEYEISKGHFMSFAQMVIQRKLIDYMRTQTKYGTEISVNPSLFDCDSEEEDDDAAMKAAVAKTVKKQSGDSIKLEIEAVNQIFAGYGFSFFDLAACSPKAEKTKKSCAKAVAFIIRNSVYLGNMRKTKLLPIKEIEKNINIPRKILERHRKYLIAAAEIMTGDYPFLADYMRYVREELNK